MGQFLTLLALALNPTLADSIAYDDYSCISRSYLGETTFFVEDTQVWLVALREFDNGFSSFDQNSNGVFNAEDLIHYLTADWGEQPEYPPLEAFTPGSIFGEGNQQLDPLTDEYLFGFFKRTPADEISSTYSGWDLNSFRMDLIHSDGSQEIVIFVRKTP